MTLRTAEDAPLNMRTLSQAWDDEDAFVAGLVTYWRQLGPSAQYSVAEVAEHYRRLGGTRTPDRTIAARSPREQ